MRLFVLGIGLLLPALAEVALRLFGVAPDGMPWRETFHDPPPRFMADRGVVRANPESIFLAPQSFPLKKERGEVRIFVVGGSAAMGFPQSGTFSPARLLEAGLREASPSRAWRVINAAGYGHASRDVLRTVREIVAYGPDYVVVMSGNNEYLERRYYPSDLEDVSKAVIVLSRLRIFRAAAGAWHAIKGDTGEIRWGPHIVSDGEQVLVRAEFEDNIEAMKRACREHGAGLVLVTPPVNLSGYRPYGRSLVPPRDQEKIDKTLRAASADKSGRTADELNSLLDASWSSYPRDAWLAFMRGKAKEMECEGEGTEDGDSVSLGEDGSGVMDEQPYGFADRFACRREALGFYRLARDLDPVPVRATSALHEIVRARRGDRGVIIADPALGFDGQILAGEAEEERFFDHCHPTPEGQKDIALAILDAVVEAGLVKAPGGWGEGVMAAYGRMEDSLPGEAVAESHYRIGYETGVNMGRVFRGLDHAREALRLDPSHRKARMLEQRLEPEAKERYRLVGD